MDKNMEVIDLETMAGTMAESWNKAVNTPYLAVYYQAVSRIPDYYKWDEWKESEERIYRNMHLQIQGHFNAPGTRHSEMYEALTEEFRAEREKLLMARERCLEKKSCGLI